MQSDEAEMICHRELAAEVLQALGVDSPDVVSFELRWSGSEVATLTVTRFVRRPQGAALIALLRRQQHRLHVEPEGEPLGDVVIDVAPGNQAWTPTPTCLRTTLNTRPRPARTTASAESSPRARRAR